MYLVARRISIPLETTGLGVLTFLLVLIFYFFPYKRYSARRAFFVNFGNEALVTICSLLVVGRGLETTGALQPLADFHVATLDRSDPVSRCLVPDADHRRRAAVHS